MRTYVYIPGPAHQQILRVPAILGCRRHAGRTRVLTRKKRHGGRWRKKSCRR